MEYTTEIFVHFLEHGSRFVLDDEKQQCAGLVVEYCCFRVKGHQGRRSQE